MSYATQKLRDISVIKTGKLDSNAAVENGAYPFFTCDPQTLRINKWAYDTEAVLLAGNNASGNYTAKYYRGKFNAYQRTYIIEAADSERLSVRFLCYAINQQLRLLKTMSSGSTTKFLTIRMLHNLDIPCPKIEVQDRIVNVLGTIDDLIENNQKQIKLLEEAAQRLYKEWFVDLRFPGYEDTPIVDGVPEGWEKVPVGNLISYEIGGGWGEETPTGKCIREAYVIRGTDLYGIAHGDLLSIPFRYHVESNLSSRKLKDGDIVFEVSGGSRTEGVARCLLITSSMLNVWRKDVMCASFCKLIRPQFGFSQYLHDCIKHLRATGKTEEYDKRSASSIVNYRWKDFLSQALVLRPSEEILDHYNGVAKEIYSKAINCSLQIESAKKARDRLLPKLMSGEIEV